MLQSFRKLRRLGQRRGVLGILMWLFGIFLFWLDAVGRWETLRQMPDSIAPLVNLLIDGRTLIVAGFVLVLYVLLHDETALRDQCAALSWTLTYEPHGTTCYVAVENTTDQTIKRLRTEVISVAPQGDQIPNPPFPLLLQHDSLDHNQPHAQELDLQPGRSVSYVFLHYRSNQPREGAYITLYFALAFLQGPMPLNLYGVTLRVTGDEISPTTEQLMIFFKDDQLRIEPAPVPRPWFALRRVFARRGKIRIGG